MTADLKREFLRLLEEDEEFRYAVAGRIGILEILKRLDRLEEGQNRLWEEVRSLREGQNRLEESMARLQDAVALLTRTQGELAKQVGALSETIGFGLEDIARVVVPGWLQRHEGIVMAEEFTRKWITVDGEEIEVNLYGEGMKDG
ncbi:MAG: hypothetical protein QXI19_14285, partial [Candidatus Caldarchaeum sp.]